MALMALSSEDRVAAWASVAEQQAQAEAQANGTTMEDDGMTDDDTMDEGTAEPM